jgi:hypothetical protein
MPSLEAVRMLGATLFLTARRRKSTSHLKVEPVG